MNDFFKDIKNVLLIIIFSLFLFFCLKTINLNAELNQSYKILDDSIYYYTNKLDEMYLMKETYITDIENLKEINDELYAEAEKLKNNPIIITKIETETIIDSIEIESVKYIKNDSIFNDYYYDNEWLSMDINHAIINDIGKLTINNISMNSMINSSIIEKNNKLYFINRSNNPYLHITNIDGAILNLNDIKIVKQHMKNNETFFDKIDIGCAIGPTIFYDFRTKNVKFGTGFTAGIIIKF